jgi:DNA-binding NarL/FixJ family response regulator
VNARHDNALREMAVVVGVLGQMPGQRPVGFWQEVARIVARRNGLTSLRPGAPPVCRADVLLTTRQVEMLRLVAAGLTVDQIAARLTVSRYTVKTTLATAYKSIGASNAPNAVAIAMRGGAL